MNEQTFELEFITPAFLCGADQNRAELRPASIRGQIRWWYRILGATLGEEHSVFGGVHGKTTASKIIVRVSDIKPKHEAFERLRPMSNRGYIYYFATVSGERKGIRVEAKAYFAPGTRFTLHLLKRTPLTPTEEKRFDLAVNCFIRLGGLGLRMTRGCGALTSPAAVLSREDFKKWCSTLPSQLTIKETEEEPMQTAASCQEHLGGFLRDFRQTHHLSGRTPTALGFSEGTKREASALHLRPVKVKEGYLPVLVYTDAASSQSSLSSLFL